MDSAVQFQRGGARADIPEATVRLAVRTKLPPIVAVAADPSIDVPEMPATVSALVDRLVPEAHRLLPGGNNFRVFTRN